MFINIKITSKNSSSLKNFIKDFKTLSKNKKLNLVRFVQFYQNKKSDKIFTILKSPHVNKKAQEQFEYKLYSKNIKVKSFQPFKFLILLKNFQKYLHTDVNIKIKFILSKKDTNSLNNLKKIKYVKTTNVRVYLLLLYFYGNKKFNRLNSSVGRAKD